MAVIKRMGALGLFALAGLNGAAVTLTYDVQGVGATPVEQEVAAEGTYGALAEPEGAAGFAFGGWWTAWGGRMVRVTPSLPVLRDEDHALVARWDAAAENQTIDTRLTYDMQGHGVAPEPFDVGESSTYGNLPVPDAEEGQVFDGWWVKKDGFFCRAETGEHVFHSADCVLIAHWAGESIKSVEVDTRLVYDTQGVGEVLAEKVRLGNAPTYGELVVPPAPAGMLFDGWWVKKFDHSIRVESGGEAIFPDDGILRAKWDAETIEIATIVTGWIEIRFVNPLDETWSATKTVAVTLPYGELPQLSLVGYWFNGWNTSLDPLRGIQVSPERTIRIEDGCTLYAQWTPVPTFDPATMTKVVIDERLSVVIPNAWFAKHGFSGDDFAAIAKNNSPGTDGKGKFSVNGNPVEVWEDYVAGTDPNDSDDLLTAELEMVNGQPLVNWRPSLNGVDANGDSIQKGVRSYRIWGKGELTDECWHDIDQEPGDYRFFKVSVEMR